jgi:hypothetical protein
MIGHESILRLKQKEFVEKPKNITQEVLLKTAGCQQKPTVLYTSVAKPPPASGKLPAVSF